MAYKLGHGSTQDEIAPRIVASLHELRVKQVACGANHTCALVGNDILSTIEG